MSLDLNGKTITDPLYGNITLTKLESHLASTRVFQRLHSIRQLGLGHLVFPSAAYSRFSHSVGACHNADRILSAIEANSNRRFSDTERQAFRIAALLHDLGHYPFSHTTEHAIRRYYQDGIYKQVTPSAQGELDIQGPPEIPPTYLDHEETGNLIFLEDPEIESAFDTAGSISKDDVLTAFLNENLSTIISSDLDCDRLDYLRRTSVHSGAPYGDVDVDFIISKSTVDSDGRFCFDRKALRATDHLLVSRFYDFMQIPYHKTVAALEWSLEEAVIYLLREKKLKLSETDIRRQIANGAWSDFDDGAMVDAMRRALRGIKDDVAADHLRAVLRRKAAKLVYNWECLIDEKNDEQISKEKLLRYRVKEVAQNMGLDERRFAIWKAPFKLSKAGPILQGSPSDRDYSDEEAQQLIHILLKDKSKSTPLIDLNNAVSHHLSQLRYRVIRIYYLPSSVDGVSIKKELRTQFEDY